MIDKLQEKIYADSITEAMAKGLCSEGCHWMYMDDKGQANCLSKAGCMYR